MADKPIKNSLPADLPENWQYNQVVAPTGEEVGLTPQHGYNYLMRQVNIAQAAINAINNAFPGLLALGADNKVPVANLPIDAALSATSTNPVQNKIVNTALAGKVPTTRTVNNKALNANISLTAADVGAVPTTRKVNNKALSGDISLTAADVGARPSNWTPTAANVGAVPTTRTVNNKALSANITLTAADVGAAAASHNHNASNITAGILPIARGGTGNSNGYIRAGQKAGTTIGTKATAEGNDTTASGLGSHAEGYLTMANGEYSHAGGRGTIADDYQYVIGTYNREISADNLDVFIVGGGTGTNVRKNAFRVNASGACYGLTSFKTSGADYAEYFEWLDKNQKAEDRVGYFVTLEGEKIRKANADDYILGIVSANPCIIGNADEDWLGRWEHDEFGRFIKVEVETPVTKMQEKEVPILDENGEPTGEVRIEMEEVATGEVIKGWDYKQNPDYDSSQQYIERKDRQEWSAIGMLGVLAVRDDGSCKVNGFCQCADGGVATAADKYIPGQTYRVIARVAENIVKVVFR